MKNKLVSIIFSLFLFASIITPVLAQDYHFEVPEQDIHVFMEPDGSITIEYYYLFKNTPGAHIIDFVDIGMPGNSTYSLGDITATINNQTITDIQNSPYVDGVALGLGANAIPAGSSGIVYMRAENISGQFYFASMEEEEEYTSMRFQPNYFSSDFVGGISDMMITFHLPQGLTDQEPRWFSPKNWPGEEVPASSFDDEGRIIYQWSYSKASASKKYEFGVAFPARLIPVETINTEQTVTFNPSDILGTLIPIACCGGSAGLFALVIYLASKSAKKRKLKYLPPKIAIEGHGIKRGLTSVEAAILLEQPMDKILTMILFSVLRKNSAQVISRDPLKVKVEDELPEGLRDYEISFLKAFKGTKSAAKRKQLQDMIVALVKSVSTKMKGFSRKETITYYQDIINKAWEQVEKAETPEVRAEKYSKAVDWTMLDRNYDQRTRRMFGSGPVYMPYWWWRADPTISRSATSRSVGSSATRGLKSSAPSVSKSKTITLPHLPGSNAAASLTNTVTAFSAGVVGNLTSFTSGITNKTNPVPKPSSSTFRSTGSRSGRSSGGSSSCACACACAGCACACAGGGR
ncbi:MAG: hypothetical protein J7K66_07515 [Anaerolineaceae bacterium]|nr:hypothetical protein [Anaerolineaceae bacterium]